MHTCTGLCGLCWMVVPVACERVEITVVQKHLPRAPPPAPTLSPQLLFVSIYTSHSAQSSPATCSAPIRTVVQQQLLMSRHTSPNASPAQPTSPPARSPHSSPATCAPPAAAPECGRLQTSGPANRPGCLAPQTHSLHHCHLQPGTVCTSRRQVCSQGVSITLTGILHCRSCRALPLAKHRCVAGARSAVPGTHHAWQMSNMRHLRAATVLTMGSSLAEKASGIPSPHPFAVYSRGTRPGTTGSRTLRHVTR